MLHTRMITSLGLVLVLSTAVACAPGPAPAPHDPVEADAAAIATAEVALAPVLGTGAGTRRLPKSLEDEVDKAPIIVVGKVSGLGPIFNSARRRQHGVRPEPDVLQYRAGIRDPGRAVP